MLAETIPESEFGYPNSVLAKTAPFFFAGFKVFHCPGISTALLPVGALHAALLPGRGIFILVCSFSCQGAVTAPQIIPMASFLDGSLL